MTEEEIDLITKIILGKAKRKDFYKYTKEFSTLEKLFLPPRQNETINALLPFNLTFSLGDYADDGGGFIDILDLKSKLLYNISETKDNTYFVEPQ